VPRIPALALALTAALAPCARVSPALASPSWESRIFEMTINLCDVIVVGTLEGSEPELLNGKVFRRSSLRVDTVIKGDPSMRVVKFHMPGGELGARKDIMKGMPRLEPGERILLFLTRVVDPATTLMFTARYQIRGGSVVELNKPLDQYRKEIEAAMASRTPRGLARRATLVVEGIVERVERRTEGEGRVIARATVRVGRILKGRVPREEDGVRVTVRYETSPNRLLPDTPILPEKARVVLFLQDGPDGDRVYVGGLSAAWFRVSETEVAADRARIPYEDLVNAVIEPE
jgi:hypothetical protein